MSSTTSPLPSDGDVNRGPILLAVFWTEIAVATIFVALRFYTRVTARNLGADDWTILVTLFMLIITLSLCTVLVYYGLGRHIHYLSAEQQLEMARWNWIVQPFGILTLPVGKISVVLLLQRLMPAPAKWRKWFLWVNMFLFSAVMIIAAIISFAQCNPPRALWEQVPGAVCWDPAIQADWAVFGSSYSSFLDFVLALLPISIVWNLKMSTKKKAGVCFLLGAGVLSGICAAVKTAQSLELGIREDMSWALFSLYAWSSSEIFLNILCACIPTLKPLYDNFASGTPIRSTKYSGYQGSRSQGSSRWLKASKASSGSSLNSDTETSTSQTMTAVEPSVPEKAVNAGVINYHRSFAVETGSQPVAGQRTDYGV